MIKYDRDRAFSIEVKDPDNFDIQEPILDSLVIGESLYLIKTNSIFRMLTADSIDPQRTALGKVRTSIPRTKNENFSHLISMGYH
ncbi:hypothetical protein [Aeromonas veronii]|uniref:hypothetical protein n=1 Tax=Aeromonas veronii TaxID=654 RepID=UPI00300471F8